MNFSEALKLLKRGHCVRRKAWHRGSYLFIAINKKVNEIYGIDNDYPSLLMYHPIYELGRIVDYTNDDYFEATNCVQLDILADDWELNASDDGNE